MQNLIAFVIPQKILSLPKFPYLTALRFFAIVGIIFMICLLAFYVFQITTVISHGYQIQNYQKKISELSQENKILEINSIKINSLVNIEDRIQELGFEKTDKIHYIKIIESQVARNK